MIRFRKTHIKVILVFFGSLCCEIATAQISQVAVPFLLVPPSARISAMGESGVALADDASASFLNPAGLGFQTGQEANLTYTGWLPEYPFSHRSAYEDIFYGHGYYKMNVPKIVGTIATSFIFFNIGTIRDITSCDGCYIPPYSMYEYAISVSYGTAVTSDLAMGLGLRLIHSAFVFKGRESSDGNVSASAVSSDIGILYRPSHIIIPFTKIDLGKSFGVGLALTNMGPSISYFDGGYADPLPTNLRVGIAFDFIQTESNKVTWTFDVNKLIISHTSTRTTYRTDPFFTALTKTWTTFSDGSKKNISDIMREVNFGTGIEYCFSNCVALRGGYFYEDPDMGNRRMFTFGMGLRYDMFGLDLSYIALYGKYTDRTPANETLRLTASMNWDKDTSK